MKTKKEWLEWFDNLDENKLSDLLSNENNIYKTPQHIDKKIETIFNNYSVKQKKVEQKVIFKPTFRYAMAFSFLLLITIGFYPLYRLFNPNLNKCIVSSINGKAFVILNNKQEKLLKVGDSIKQSSIIKTDDKSDLEIKIGNNLIINLEEQTKLKLSQLYNNKKNEKTNIYLITGFARLNHNKTDKSSFFVETSTVKIETIGTKFTVKVTTDNTTFVSVESGKLNITAKINIKDLKLIKRINKKFFKSIKKAISDGIILSENEAVEISISNFNDCENNLNTLIISVKDNINNENQCNDVINKIIKIKDKLFNITKLGNNKTGTDENKELFEIKKLPNYLNKILLEKNTGITSDYENIYITSTANNSVFCINSKNGKLLWKYENSSESELTSPIIPINNKLILSTPNKIIIFNKNGEVQISENITKGTSFWAYPIKLKDNIIIPTAQYLYNFNGSTIEQLKYFGESMGQIYISVNNNSIFSIDSNDSRIKEYDPNKNKFIWISAQMQNRILMPPVLVGKNIYIADMKSNFYKFNYNDKSLNPKILNIGTGVISNIKYYKNNLYFVANNGWLYQINANSLSSPNKLIKIDQNPNINNYLTKKLFQQNNELYFCCDSGKMFYYNIDENILEMINIKENNLPLIGTPCSILDKIFVIDSRSNIYVLTKKGLIDEKKDNI